MQNLQITDTAETRKIPKGLFLPRFPDKNRFTPSRLDAVLVAPISTRTKKEQTSNEGNEGNEGRGNLTLLYPVLLSTLIRSQFQAKPATLLIPIDFPFLFAVEELYGTRYQSGSFSLNNVGSGSHCLHSLSFSFLLSNWMENKQHQRLSQILH